MEGTAGIWCTYRKLIDTIKSTDTANKVHRLATTGVYNDSYVISVAITHVCGRI